MAPVFLSTVAVLLMVMCGAIVARPVINYDNYWFTLALTRPTEPESWWLLFLLAHCGGFMALRVGNPGACWLNAVEAALVWAGPGSPKVFLPVDETPREWGSAGLRP